MSVKSHHGGPLDQFTVESGKIANGVSRASRQADDVCGPVDRFNKPVDESMT